MKDLRATCHELIDMLPEEGLQETADSLTYCLKYWAGMKHEPPDMTPPRWIVGNFAGFVQAPPLAFEDD